MRKETRRGQLPAGFSLPAKTEPYTRLTRARTSSGPISLDASAINVPAQMAKIAVILRVIILKIPCHWGETIPASQQSGKYGGIRLAYVIDSTHGSARI
jgi:hypothetical protein